MKRTVLIAFLFAVSSVMIACRGDAPAPTPDIGATVTARVQATQDAASVTEATVEARAALGVGNQDRLADAHSRTVGPHSNPYASAPAQPHGDSGASAQADGDCASHPSAVGHAHTGSQSRAYRDARVCGHAGAYTGSGSHSHAAGYAGPASTPARTPFPTPSQPPNPLCSHGVAVPDPEDNPGLVNDCTALLTARDELAGDGRLNWGADISISAWDGIRLDRSPSRVVAIDIQSGGLTGRIPAVLG